MAATHGFSWISVGLFMLDDERALGDSPAKLDLNYRKGWSWGYWIFDETISIESQWFDFGGEELTGSNHGWLWKLHTEMC